MGGGEPRDMRVLDRLFAADSGCGPKRSSRRDASADRVAEGILPKSGRGGAAAGGDGGDSARYLTEIDEWFLNSHLSELVVWCGSHRFEKACGMIGVFVTFRYAENIDEQAVRKIAETARARFEGMP